jgi:lincosamide nucleotidyltransferase B/F
MNPADYQSFTDNLRRNVEEDERVLALVMLGSMAQPRYRDEWSDHDFWLITRPGTQEAFLSDLSWLPQHGDIVIALRQGEQYYGVLYDSGHAAVFDTEQLYRGKLNSYQFLFDKAEVAGHIQAVYERTGRGQQGKADPTFLFNHFLIILWVGVSRYRRGERLSGHRYISHYALDALLDLIVCYVPPADPLILDNLDPRRRFERAYPAVATEINALLRQEIPEAAVQMIDLAGQLLSDKVDYPVAAVNTIRALLLDA